MNVTDKTVLVTGANRGIGKALVEEALRRGARHVYAGTRQPLPQLGERVTPVTLDVTNSDQIQAAAERIESLDVLINNAGVAVYDELRQRAAIDDELAVNLFGTYHVTDAFLPRLLESRGAVVNLLSVAALAPIPIIPAYSISKAAAFNMSQSLRALLSKQGVNVHVVLTGPVDTDMSRGLDVPKASAESVAEHIFDGVARGEEEIFPDPMAQALEEGWRNGVAKTLERQFAAMVQGAPVAS
jgi:NAD(P)-dependent dehydrogenase (short-subunit alcohol dehydrogenase family)